MTKDYKKIVVLGSEYETTLTKKYENRKQWQKPNPKRIDAHIPGTVLEIKVKEGQKVKKGDLLLILQAMKMKNEIKAPFDGEILKIYVGKDERVPKSHLMVEFK